jgi:hypothetical protein
MTYEKYRGAVGGLFGALNKYINGNSKTNLFWLENTAPPLRQDYWVILKKDWRTYHRLVLFHAIAMEEMRKFDNMPISVVPAFHSTLALFDKMCDCAHYPTSAKMPQLLGLLDDIRKFG